MAKHLTKRKFTGNDPLPHSDLLGPMLDPFLTYFTAAATVSHEPKAQRSKNTSQESDDPLSSFSEPEAKAVTHGKKSKNRKSEPVVRVTYNIAESEKSDEQRVKKSRTSEPVIPNKASNEYEEDVGRNESK